MNKTKGPAQAAPSEDGSQIKNQSSSDTLSQRAYRGATTAVLWFLSSQLEAHLRSIPARDQYTMKKKALKRFLMLNVNMQGCCSPSFSAVVESLLF